MLYSILAGIICTTSSVNPDNSRYFSSKRFKVSLYFSEYYKLVNKRLHCPMPAKRLSAR